MIRETELRVADTKAELRALLKSGREFLLSLEDAELTTNDETGNEHNDVKAFKIALDRAAKAARL